MNINLYTWFGDRKLNYLPTHFVKCNAVVTEEAKFWVYETLKGRFYIDTNHTLFNDENNIYFEDSQEAVMFELKWS
jgi:hypothetical protein